MMYLFLSLAFADAVTDGPGTMHGNIGIRTTISSSSDQLIEDGNLVGKRALGQTKAELYAEFSPIRYLSLGFSVPYYNQGYQFQDVSMMTFDPQKSTGSYINSESIDDFSREGSGIGGTTLGVFFYPFHNRLFEDRADRGEWKFGVQYRLPTALHFYTTNENGDRGVGPGSDAWILYGAFSIPSRLGQPYAELQSTHSGVWTGMVRDHEGNELISQGEIRPPSSVQIRFGNELTIWEDTAFAHFVELDLYGRTAYNSWADVTTNVALPSTLNAYSDYINNQSETLEFTAGVGTNVQYNSYYHARFAFEMGMISPQNIEHLYPISTNGTLTWSILFDIRFRYRSTAT